jgi:hypothetical protein
MLSDQLLNQLQELSPTEKLRIVQLLINDLAAASNQELLQQLKPDAVYEVWSPYDSFEAAHQLQAMLDEYDREHGKP